MGACRLNVPVARRAGGRVQPAAVLCSLGAGAQHPCPTALSAAAGPPFGGAMLRFSSATPGRSALRAGSALQRLRSTLPMAVQVGKQCLKCKVANCGQCTGNVTRCSSCGGENFGDYYRTATGQCKEVRW